MTPEARILLGLALVGAGGAGLLAMNLWTVPLLRPASDRVAAPERVATLVVPSATASAASASGASPTLPLSDAGVPDVVGTTMDAAADAAADAAYGDASTSRSTDGTAFLPVVFQPQSKTPSREMVAAVDRMGRYLRHNFGMKVMLVGHGDAGMSTPEYVNLGRQRAAAVLRVLVDYGVSVSRIGIVLPKVEGDRVVAPGIAPGTVEVRIEPRFPAPKENESNVP